MRYVFADSARAERRLRLVADVFAPTSTAFLRETVTRPPELALDLGCGPGHTTHLLAGTLACARVIGLDCSERFIASARERSTERVSFQLHDVTRTPFPTPPADLLYCRFLLSHLRDPAGALAAWGTQLVPSGRLLTEELEWIRTANPTFVRYLRVVDEVLASESGCLYVGPALEALRGDGLPTTRASRVARLPVARRHAAAMFVLNVPSWKDHPYVRAHYGVKTIARLEQELAAIAEAPGDVSDIEWGLRQMVFERE